MRASTKRKNKREAQQVADEIERQMLDRKQLGHREEITLEKAVSFFLKRHQHVSDFKNVRWRLHKTLGWITPRHSEEPHKGLDPKMLVSDLRKGHFAELQSWRLAAGNSKRTINGELAAFRKLLNYLEETEEFVMPPQPVKFKLLKVKNRAKPLNETELNSLLKELDPRGYNGPMSEKATISKRDNYDFVVILADTGMRYSELSKLPWSMVDRENWSFIDVYRPKVDNDGRIVCTKRVQDILKRRWHERQGSLYVFADSTGQGPRKYAPKGIIKAFERAGINTPEKVAIFGNRSIHSLRDTFATRVRRKGMGLDGIQKLLGHSDSAMSAKYADIDTFDVSKRAVSLLDD
ncbi:tyrosine-type recombinase/integrase [Roseibium alexandrii]|nr:tyrosine-type recombinase/integrase [Roseibium alexandrii]